MYKSIVRICVLCKAAKEAARTTHVDNLASDGARTAKPLRVVAASTCGSRSPREPPPGVTEPPGLAAAREQRKESDGEWQQLTDGY